MIYLASQSPRRQQLLTQIGVSFELVNVEIDETPIPGELPSDYVLRMAAGKAREAWQPQMKKPLLAADTSVVADNKILGKPADEDEFMAMMQTLSGATHQVLSAVAVINGEMRSRLNISDVSFRNISNAEARRYWQSGEPADKAGGYGIQGLAAIFINNISGSYSGVMGLPLYETAELLQDFNVTVL